MGLQDFYVRICSQSDLIHNGFKFIWHNCMVKIQLLVSQIDYTLALNLNYFIIQFSPPLALACTLGFLFPSL